MGKALVPQVTDDFLNQPGCSKMLFQLAWGSFSWLQVTFISDWSYWEWRSSHSRHCHITGNPQAQLSVISVAWDQIIRIFWLLFAVIHVSPKTEQILFHKPGRAQWKQGPKLVLHRWSSMLLAVKENFCICFNGAGASFSPGLHFWLVFKLWVRQQLSGSKEPVGHQTHCLSQPQFSVYITSLPKRSRLEKDDYCKREDFVWPVKAKCDEPVAWG